MLGVWAFNICSRFFAPTLDHTVNVLALLNRSIWFLAHWEIGKLVESLSHNTYKHTFWMGVTGWRRSKIDPWLLIQCHLALFKWCSVRCYELYIDFVLLLHHCFLSCKKLCPFLLIPCIWNWVLFMLHWWWLFAVVVIWRMSMALRRCTFSDERSWKLLKQIHPLSFDLIVCDMADASGDCNHAGALLICGSCVCFWCNWAIDHRW